MIIKTTKHLSKAHPSDAAFDLEADEDTFVYGYSRKLISTGVRMAIPEGYCGIIKSRSGLAVKNSIEVGAGVIDAGYRGEIKVLLCNYGEDSFYVKPGDRIAQLMIVPVPAVTLEVVEDLDETTRSDKGFGSTGLNAILADISKIDQGREDEIL
jgi:dUTP pyrophosphatase